MPQDITIPQPVTPVATDRQIVDGPDGKKYNFSKKFSQDQINKYFARKGIKAPEKKTIDNKTTDTPTTGASPGNVAMGQNAFTGFGTALQEYGAAAMPTALATAGAMAGGGRGPLAVVGAGTGGFVGEDIRQMMMRPILLARGQQDLSSTQSLLQMAKEGGKQAALQYGGEKAGDYFFKALTKVIPHATTKGGIPLLPSDVKPGGKMMRYVEDLLTNLAPSSGTMEQFITKQSLAASAKADRLAQGFARFNGTNEELGNLLQNTLRTEEQVTKNQLDKMLKQLPKGKQTYANLRKTSQFANDLIDSYNKTFLNELNRAVVKTEKPELIAADMLISKNAGLENTRVMMELLHEKNPELLGKVQNRIMRNILNDTLTGAKDPTIRDAAYSNRFSGKSFVQNLDRIGEEKLKAIYGEQGYKSIKKFEELTAHIDRTSGNSAGRWVNLMLFVSPIRSGLSPKTLGKSALTGIVVNRIAHIITDPKGIGIAENLIKASALHAPRLVDLAVKEMNVYNERSDAEYKAEEEEAKQEFLQNQAAINKLDVKDQSRVGAK